MESYSGKLHLWEGWMPPPVKAAPGVSARHTPEEELADRLFAAEAFTSPNRSREGAQPFSLQWYLDIEQARYRRQGKWLPHLLEFQKHQGERLLGLGTGLGTDWLQYARHGASVTVCTPTHYPLAYAQRNFELRNLKAEFLHSNQGTLPLESATIDVVCCNGLLDPATDSGRLVTEVYRVLKPGGKVLAVAGSRYDVEFWRRCFLPWHTVKALRRPPDSRVGYTARHLKALFGTFVEPRVHKRHLRRSEVPHLWRWLPMGLLERMLGRMLILKAFKPLSAAMTSQMAA